MGIEGQFAGLAARTRHAPAFAGNGRGRDYLCDIRRFKMLERDQEYSLAKRWREHGDRDAANPVTSHLHSPPKSPWATAATVFLPEIISEGNVRPDAGSQSL